MHYGNAQPAKSKRLASGTPSWPKTGMQFNIDNPTLFRKGRLTEKKIRLKLNQSLLLMMPFSKRPACEWLFDIRSTLKEIISKGQSKLWILS
jgi:hypothetical protein